MHLLAWAAATGAYQQGEIFGPAWRQTMAETIDEIARALAALSKPAPDSPDLKASDDFLDPLFRRFFEKLALPNLMAKTNYHTLAPHVPADALDLEVRAKLDAIVEVAGRARPLAAGNDS
jgi:hypothetical protein